MVSVTAVGTLLHDKALSFGGTEILEFVLPAFPFTYTLGSWTPLLVRVLLLVWCPWGYGFPDVT